MPSGTGDQEANTISDRDLFPAGGRDAHQPALLVMLP